MNEEQLNSIEENIEELPQEVKDFIFGDEMAAVKKELTALISSDSIALSLSNTLMLFLLGQKNTEDLTRYIDGLGLSDEKTVMIKNIIQEKVIESLLLTIEVHGEMDQETSEPTLTTQPPSDVLANLGARLSQSSVIAPSKRDYSLEKPATNETPVPHAFDPYRELPEK